jgi:putative DNA primase/helicase
VSEAPTFGVGSEDFRQAEWLAFVLDRKWRHDFSTKTWHNWDGTRWAPDKTNKILNTVATAAALAVGSAKTDIERKALIKLLSIAPAQKALEALATFDGYGTSGEDWDQDEFLLGCSNGIVDLRTNALIPNPDPSCLVTKTTGHAFKPLTDPSEFRKRAPRFIQFLDEITSGDVRMIGFLIQWFGSSMFGFSPEQRFLLMIGIGRNGKGVLKNSVIHALGEYADQPDANVYMRNKFGSVSASAPRAELIALKGKRMCFFSEPGGMHFNEEMLKAHTGGDFITARTLHSAKMLTWKATHSITFLVNDAPEIDDIGPSMTNRVMVADFRERYDGDKEDKRLEKTLEKEAEGILAILCWAAKAWYDSYEGTGAGIEIPERVQEQSKAFMERGDPIAHCLNEAFNTGPGLKWQAGLCYQAYLQWFARSGEEGEAVSQVKFSRGLEKKGFKKTKTMHGTYYLGMKPQSAVDLADREGEGEDNE